MGKKIKRILRVASDIISGGVILIAVLAFIDAFTKKKNDDPFECSDCWQTYSIDEENYGKEW